MFKRNFFVSIILMIGLFGSIYASYSPSIGAHGTLIAPRVILSSEAVLPASVMIQGHRYGVKYYVDHPILKLRLLFLDYPVLTSKSVLVMGSKPQEVLKRTEYISASSAPPSRSLVNFGSGYYLAPVNLLPIGVRLDHSHVFMVNAERPKELVGNNIQYGAGIFSGSGSNVRGLIGVTVPIQGARYGIAGNKHLLFINNRTRAWISNLIAHDVLGRLTGNHVPGYIATALPIKNISVSQPIVTPPNPIPVVAQPKPTGDFSTQFKPKPTPTKAPYKVKYVNPGKKFTKAGIDYIVQSMGKMLDKYAFVYGVNFKKSEWQIMKHRPSYINSTNADVFKRNMYDVLNKTFGVSHLYIEQTQYRAKSRTTSISRRTPRPWPSFIKAGRAGFDYTPKLKWHTIKGKRIPQFIIPDFGNDYSKTKIASIARQVANSPWVIVDVRDNPGGDSMNLLDTIKYFLPDKKIFAYGVDRQNYDDYLSYTSKRNLSLPDLIRDMTKELGKDSWRMTTTPRSSLKIKGKIIVLMDGGTGSNGEVLAEALKTFRNAIGIGETTAGAVLGSEFHPVAGGFDMALPAEDYITSDFKRIEKVGVPPSPGFRTSSPGALSKAIQYLRTRL